MIDAGSRIGHRHNSRRKPLPVTNSQDINYRGGWD